MNFQQTEEKEKIMTISAIVINIFVLVCLLVSLIKNRTKTIEALKIAFISVLKIIPTVLTIIILIGLLLAFISEELISNAIGEKSGSVGILISALLGSVLHIPAIIAFPLAASLIKGGASIAAAAAFITTLMMIGFITLPIEIKEMGIELTILRNSLSFVAAIIIAILMGALI